MCWANAMASLKGLLLYAPGNSADPHATNLAQAMPTLNLSESKHISCNAQPFNAGSNNHAAVRSKCKPTDKYSTTKATTLLPSLPRNFKSTVTQIDPKADISTPNCLSKKVTQSYGDKSSSSYLSQAKESSEPLKIPSRKRLKQTPKPILNITQPSQVLPYSTSDGVNPHALPTDLVFQSELGLLKRDAAAANMELTNYITANRTKYQRVSRYLWCLPDDFIF